MSRNAKLLEPAPRATRDAEPRVWILLSNRTGDDNQARALAEALGWPFESKTLSYNGARHVPFLRDERLIHLTDEARGELVAPWPDLVIGVGYESVPVARFIRSQSQGRTRLIQIGNPRTDIGDIDLVIATPQYSLPAAPNLLEIPFPIGNPARDAVPTATEQEWLEGMPRPRRLVAVGGSTRQWNLDITRLEKAIIHLKHQRAAAGGSVIAVTSRRTPPALARRLEGLLSESGESCVGAFPRFPVLLSQCDEFHVTADSVSMLAEAILTGKPVAMIPVRRSRRGLIGHLVRKLGIPLKTKADLSAFWGYLAANQLVGPIGVPVASAVRETTQMAVEAARAMMNRSPQPRIWALLGARQGDNNQVLALAEAIGLPFQRMHLTYNRLRHLGPRLLGASFRSLTPSSRIALSAGVPDLTISTGHRSVAPVQLLRKRSGGKVRSIHVGYPRISPGKFELVIATPEYPVPDHPNLLRIPFALTREIPRVGCDAEFWKQYPAPRRLLLLGGPTLYWRLGWQVVSETLDSLLATASREGGSVIVIASPRTPTRLLFKAATQIRNDRTPATIVPVGGSPSYAELLHHADTVVVTADSVAMVSDAIANGKTVGLVPVAPSVAGRFLMALMDRVRPDELMRPRDLRTFWRVLEHEGLAGTVWEPKRAAVPDVNRIAARRSQAILEQAASGLSSHAGDCS